VILNAVDCAGRRRRRAHESPVTRDTDESLDAVDPEWHRPYEHVEANADLLTLLQQADDPLVWRAIALMCGEGVSQRDAAKSLGVKESRLSRALARFFSRARLATSLENSRWRVRAPGPQRRRGRVSASFGDRRKKISRRRRKAVPARSAAVRQRAPRVKSAESACDA
jgi:hypothetical protein